MLCSLRGCPRGPDVHVSAWWRLSRDPKVVEKQKETPSVDRPPPTLSTTASKSVQVDGAVSVCRGQGCGGAPWSSGRLCAHCAFCAGYPGHLLMIVTNRSGCSSSLQPWVILFRVSRVRLSPEEPQLPVPVPLGLRVVQGCIRGTPTSHPPGSTQAYRQLLFLSPPLGAQSSFLNSDLCCP